MREKVEGERAEAKIRGNTDRTRVSTKTKAKTEALDIAKAIAERGALTALFASGLNPLVSAPRE